MSEKRIEEGRKIIKQAPKPTMEKYKTWDDLDKILDIVFHQDPHNHDKKISIELHEYEINKEEIIQVLEEKGYITELREPQGKHQSLHISLKN